MSEKCEEQMIIEKRDYYNHGKMDAKKSSICYEKIWRPRCQLDI